MLHCLTSARRTERQACRGTPESKQVTIADWTLAPSSDDEAPEARPVSPEASSSASDSSTETSEAEGAAPSSPDDDGALPDLQELLPPEAAAAELPEDTDFRRAGLGILNFIIVFVVAFLLPSALPLEMQKNIGLGGITAYSVTVAAVVAYFAWPSADVLKSPAATEDDYGL